MGGDNVSVNVSVNPPPSSCSQFLRNERLANVFRAVYNPGMSILITMGFALWIMYIYALVGFVWMRDGYAIMGPNVMNWDTDANGTFVQVLHINRSGP